MSKIIVDWDCPKCHFRHETIDGCCANVCPSCSYLRSMFQAKQAEADSALTSLRTRVENVEKERNVAIEVKDAMIKHNCELVARMDGYISRERLQNEAFQELDRRHCETSNENAFLRDRVAELDVENTSLREQIEHEQGKQTVLEEESKSMRMSVGMILLSQGGAVTITRKTQEDIDIRDSIESTTGIDGAMTLTYRRAGEE